MAGKLADIINFLNKLTFRKVGAGVSLLASYYYARLTRNPQIKSLPVSIAVEPTTSCNLRCPECPSGLRAFSRPTGMLDKSLFIRLIDELKDTLCYLTFYFQGEPYLHTGFLEMTEYAENRGVYVATSTNGHYLSKEMAIKTVRSGLSRLIISMDGLDQATYEKYRVGGRLNKVIQGIENLAEAKKQLKSRKPYVILQYLAFKHNEKELQRVRAFGKKLGVDEVKVKSAQVYNFENGSDLIPEDHRLARYRKNGEGVFRLKNKLFNHCWKMWHSCVVAWDGRVVPCCFDKDARHALGDFEKNKFSEIWYSRRYAEFRRKLFRSRKKIDICRNCTEGTKVWI